MFFSKIIGVATILDRMGIYVVDMIPNKQAWFILVRSM